MRHALNGKKVLVTGGTGLIGGRVAEKLVQECNAGVRILLRNFARALRVARYPVELAYGDLTEIDQVSRAAEGCDIVVHCAYGNSGDEAVRRSVNVLGTKNALEAALRARVKRFVHISTMQVYGPLPDGDIDESVPRRYFGHAYSDSKLEAEELVLEYARQHGLPAVILQPTIVYGPYSLIWTVNLLSSLRKQRHILVDGGFGFCNAVYVDDVADSILLAAVRDEAVGESFMISAEHPVTWRDFYAGYERMLGFSGTIPMPAEEAKAYEATAGMGTSLIRETLSILRKDPLLRQRLLNTREVAFFKEVAAALLPENVHQSLKRRIKGENGNKPMADGDRSLKTVKVEARQIRPLRFPMDVRYYQARARIRIDKAKRLLGYEPSFDLAAGMKCTQQWAAWANLLDSGPVAADSVEDRSRVVMPIFSEPQLEMNPGSRR